MEQRGEDYFQRVRTGFMFEAGRNPARYRLVNAAPDKDTVQKEVRGAVARVDAVANDASPTIHTAAEVRVIGP